MMGSIWRFASVLTLVVLLVAAGCAKREPEGAAGHSQPGASDAKQADGKTD
jgi:hypothetical protein